MKSQLVTNEFVGYREFQLLIFVSRFQRMKRGEDGVCRSESDHSSYHVASFAADQRARLHAYT